MKQRWNGYTRWWLNFYKSHSNKLELYTRTQCLYEVVWSSILEVWFHAKASSRVSLVEWNVPDGWSTWSECGASILATNSRDGIFNVFFSIMENVVLSLYASFFRSLLRLTLDTLMTVAVSIFVVVVIDVAVKRTAAATTLSRHLAGINVHKHALLCRRGNLHHLPRW